MTAPDDEDILSADHDPEAVEQMLLLHMVQIQNTQTNWIEGGCLMVTLYAVEIAKRVAENIRTVLLNINSDSALRGNLRDIDVATRQVTQHRRLRMAIYAARLMVDPDSEKNCTLAPEIRRTVVMKDYFRALCASDNKLLWTFQALLGFSGLERHVVQHVYVEPEPTSMCCAWPI